MKFKNTFLGFILIFLSAFFLSDLLVSSQNIFYNNTFWLPFRTSFYGLHGHGIESLLARSMIAEGKLREHRLRVFSKEAFVPKRIDFKFRLLENSFVDVIFNGSKDSYEAVRITSEHWRQSFQFKALHNGKYLWKKAVPLKIKTAVTIEGRLRSENDHLFLYLDSEKYPIEGKFLNDKVGFDLSDSAQIWDPIITDSSGKMISAPFKTNDHWYQFFIPHLLIIVFIAGLAPLLSRQRQKAFLSASSFLFLLTLFLFVFDNLYYSRKQFRFNASEFTFENRDRNGMDVEDLRYRMSRKWYEILGGHHPDNKELMSKGLWPLHPFTLRHCKNESCQTYFPPDYPAFTPKTKKSLRVLVWGGSMSAGDSLMSLEESYPDLIFHDFRLHYKDRNVELVNTSRASLETEVNLKSLDRDIQAFKPDVILVDALIPLDKPATFEPVIKFIAERVPQFIFLRLPWSYERYSKVDRKLFIKKIEQGLQQKPNGSFYFRNDQLFQSWMNKYGMKFIDVNPDMLSDEVLYGGDLFWDPWHLTGYGHDKWSQFLSQKLFQILK